MFVADTHVHFYPPIDYSQELPKILRRMQRLVPGGSHYALLLTESAQCDEFSVISSLPGAKIQSEGVVLWGNTTSQHSAPLIIVQGFQARTIERLEVLALAATTRPPDGLPLKDTIELVQQIGGIPCVPWSFGKWTGKRKHTLISTLTQVSSRPLMIGDITTRRLPFPSRLPKLPILYGSDPLPLKGEVNRIGSSITLIESEKSQLLTLAEIRKLITASNSQIQTMGTRLPWLRPFVDTARLLCHT